jgi:hypothetical protein
MNKPLPGGKRRGWSNHYRLFATRTRAPNARRLFIRKMVNGVWVVTAKAHDLGPAVRHAEAVGGHVQILDGNGQVVLEVIEREPDFNFEL